jgi:hypothetical protein
VAKIQLKDTNTVAILTSSKRIAGKMQNIIFLESYMFSIDNWYPFLNGELKKALIFNTIWLM